MNSALYEHRYDLATAQRLQSSGLPWALAHIYTRNQQMQTWQGANPQRLAELNCWSRTSPP